MWCVSTCGMGGGVNACVLSDALGCLSYRVHRDIGASSNGIDGCLPCT